MEGSSSGALKQVALKILIAWLLSACTLNWQTDDQDYNITARVESTPEGCVVDIKRQEVRKRDEKDATVKQ